MLTVFLCDAGAAAFGYLTFGSYVADDILSNYSASSPTVLIALIGEIHIYIPCTVWVPDLYT